MATTTRRNGSHGSPPPRRSGIRLGRLAGVEIRLDFSVAIIFALVVYSLGAGVLPEWHPGWGAVERWLVALAAGLAFFASLLAHELAHSIVAIRNGIAVPGITLFLFGGVSEMSREPDSPAIEFRIAIAGPLTSLAIGLFCIWSGSALAGSAVLGDMLEQPGEAMAGLGAVETLLLWLGPVNLVLGIFNLIPGFPLDGGRVLRAALWWLHGDLERATRTAGNAGRGVGFGLMALGLLEVMQGAALQGIWLILIGWFLQSAAVQSQAQVVVRRALSGLRVSDLMRTHFETVDAAVPLSVFIEEQLLRSDQYAWPVVDGETPVGIVTFDDVRARLESGERHGRVGDAARPIDAHLDPGTSGRDALEKLVASDVDPLPVVADGRIVGLLRRADIMRWLAMHQLRS